MLRYLTPAIAGVAACGLILTAGTVMAYAGDYDGEGSSHSHSSGDSDNGHHRYSCHTRHGDKLIDVQVGGRTDNDSDSSTGSLIDLDVLTNNSDHHRNSVGQIAHLRLPNDRLRHHCTRVND